MPRTVAEAMVGCAYVHGPQTTVDELRVFFDDDHVHCAVVVDGGRLAAVVTRDDLASADGTAVASRYGSVAHRVVRPDAELDSVRLWMVRSGARRLAVVGKRGEFLGLLCLKRTGAGFCADGDIRARAADPASSHGTKTQISASC